MDIETLKKENEKQLQIITEIGAEKIALDQLYVEGIKNALQLRKDLIMTQVNLKRVESEKETLAKEIEELKKEIETLKAPNIQPLNASNCI